MQSTPLPLPWFPYYFSKKYKSPGFHSFLVEMSDKPNKLSNKPNKKKERKSTRPEPTKNNFGFLIASRRKLQIVENKNKSISNCKLFLENKLECRSVN